MTSVIGIGAAALGPFARFRLLAEFGCAFLVGLAFGDVVVVALGHGVPREGRDVASAGFKVP
jgi:hypothetical protein